MSIRYDNHGQITSRCDVSRLLRVIIADQYKPTLCGFAKYY